MIKNINYDFTDQVVLITGGSRGIGREAAQQFAAAGARVIVNFVNNRSAAEQTLAALAGDGHSSVQANIGDAGDCQRLVDTVIAGYGRIDVLVNNAAIFERHPIASADFSAWQTAWQSTLQINLIGAANLCYLCSQHMIAAGRGHIVNVSSRGAFRGEPVAPAYGASKAGLNAMGQSLAKALAPHNIFVHTVAPGFVETEMAAAHLAGPEGDGIRQQSPLGRVATPAEVANAILFCASEESSFMTGCILDVNGASYLRS